MNYGILQSSNPENVRTYVTRKFQKFAGWQYSKKTRIQKCIAYYNASTADNKKIVASVYWWIFKESFPTALAERAIPEGPGKMESSEWLELQQERLGEHENALETLKIWKETGEYQMGEGFYSQLQSRVAEVNPELVDPRLFQTEFQAKCTAELTGKTSRTAKSASAEFEGMLGFKQNSGIRYESGAHPKWGEINAKLEQSFKAGIWGKGSAQATMGKLGISADVQAAIAFGMEFGASGECTWKKGKAGLMLAGETSLFAGAKANVGISAKVGKSIEASISAEAFAGFEARASGTCGFTYGDATLASVTAEAIFQVGAGAKFDASLKAPIFGPTQISMTGTLTLGVGGGTSVTTQINFSEAGLAASEQFRKLVYLPTLMKGYRMDLITSDKKNLHYLEKCITRLEEERDGIEESISSFQKIPVEKRSLLMSAGT